MKTTPYPFPQRLEQTLSERIGIYKKADDNIRNIIEMLLKEGINPTPVFVSAVSKYCPQPPPPPSSPAQTPTWPSSHTQAPPPLLVMLKHSHYSQNLLRCPHTVHMHPHIKRYSRAPNTLKFCSTTLTTPLPYTEKESYFN